MSEVTFSVAARPQRNSRYTLSNVRETAEGGRVGVGVDAKGNGYIVHEIGRATEAISIGACATAVAAGSIPVSALVGAFMETGKLEDLAKAVAKAQTPPEPEKK